MTASSAKDRLGHLLGLPGNRVTYEQARDLLDHPDPEVRRSLAAHPDLEPEILFFLARDPDISVRRAIALNNNSPAKAALLLAADECDDVRCDLAGRVGKLVPGLSKEQQAAAWRNIHQVLTLLVRDQLPRVRRILSETLKLLPDAPHDIVLTLAGDAESSVAMPVLEFSPVLTDEDLLAVIQASPLTASLTAIARRINVGEEVSHALVVSGQVDVITALLKNRSAQIREETLDAIVDAAPQQSSWHEPLVHRRNLSTKLALRIAQFVSESLLQTLAQSQDIDPVTVETLSQMMRDKLHRDTANQGLAATDPTGSMDADALALAQRQVAALVKAGKLSQRHVMHACAEGAAALAVTALAQMARLPTAAAVEVVRTASAKGMLALAWAADFSAEDAVQLQLKLARVPPDFVVHPRPGGGFDATEAELEWQIDMFTDLAQAHGAQSA